MVQFIQTLFLHWQRWRRWLLWAGLVGLGLGAAAWLLWATAPYGIGIRTDSVAYIWSAQNLVKGIGLGRLNGAGLLKPMTHWPPLYSLILSLPLLVKIDIYAAARWLGALFTGASLLLAGLVVERLTASLWFALGVAAVLLVAPGLWESNLYAMSEPLYLLLSLAALLAMESYVRRGGRARFAAAAACLALAFLSRYVGAALIAAVALALLTCTQWPWRRRITTAVSLGALACLPMLLWMAYNQLVAGAAATDRALGLFLIPATHFPLLGQTILRWVSPAGVTFDIGGWKLLLAAAAVAWGFLAHLAAPSQPASSPAGERFPFLARLLAIYTLLYALFVVASRLFFDPLISIFDERIIFPISANLLFLAAWGLNAVKVRLEGYRWWAGAGLAVVVVMAGWSFFQVYRIDSAPTIRFSREVGMGLAPMRLHPPEAISAFLALPSPGVVYTNDIERLYLYSGRYSYQSNDRTPEDFQALGQRIAGTRFVFVAIDSPGFIENLLLGIPDLKVIYNDGGSAVLTSP